MKRCDTCAAYQFPPDDFKGPADIGFCKTYGAASHESDSCPQWQPRAEEE